MKKLERKIKKHQCILMRDNIQIVEKPTKIIAIANVGLVNGLSEEKVLNSLRIFGDIADVLMPPGKSYCFVCFTTVESAISCYIACNGKLSIAQDNKPIYLSFVEKLPEFYESKVWNVFPPGLILLEDFIDEEEERKLINLQNFANMQSGNMKHRQVYHYGYEFKYDKNTVDKDEPLEHKIPNECDFMWPRLAERCPEFATFLPDQLTVNHYTPGQGIPSHVDTHSAFIDPIMSLSLGSSIIMEFKLEDRFHCILVPRRSLLIMSKESRYLWSHGIIPRKYDIVRTQGKCDSLIRSIRISYTFRKLSNVECDCQFNSKCDSFKKEQEKSRHEFKVEDDKIALELEKVHVHDVYKNIADHFSDTRHKPWPNIVKFIETLEKGSILVDIGCGNGKYLGINEDSFSLGCDRSLGLMDVCKDKGFQTVTCDCLSVPIRDNIADACICIAVIHHLATDKRRSKALKEIVRILKPGGRALIYVWAKDQFSENMKSNYIKEQKQEDHEISNSVQKINLSEEILLPIHTNRTQFKHKDLLVPWKLKTQSQDKVTFLRFYHVYEQNELETSCKQLSNVKIISRYYDQGNWCVEFEKIKDS